MGEFYHNMLMHSIYFKFACWYRMN